MSAFEELGLCPEIIQAVEEEDWLLPTPVQQEAVPLILTGGDVLVAAETGSGKTGAFGLPCLQIVHEQLRGKCQTLVSAATAQGCELDAADRDFQVSLEDGGNFCSSPDDRHWAGVRATAGVLHGKYMYEIEVVEGLVRVGWSAPFTKLELGIEDNSFGYGCTGKRSVGKKFEDYGDGFQAGDIIGCLLDRDKQTIAFCKNGKHLGVAFELPQEVRMVGLKPHICGKAFKVAVKLSGTMEYPVDDFSAVGEADVAHIVRASAQAKVKHPPMCIILEPTRELAEQTYKCMVKFGKHLNNPPVKISLFVGGMDEKAQLSALDAGVDICVGTLQKVMDHVRRGKIDVTRIKFLVLDEADDLQKKDERKDIPQLSSQIKAGRRDRVQTLFFSATLHTAEVTRLVEEITTKPMWVDLKGKDSVPDTVHHVMCEIDPSEGLVWADSEIATRAKFPNEQPSTDGMHSKPSLSPTDKDQHKALQLSEKIKQMKPKALVKIADAFKMSQCLVFCRTNIDCDNLEAYLHRLGGTKKASMVGGKVESGKENPYSCVVLAGARNMRERQANLEAFKEGDVRFLICTDVAARGLDIAALPFVVQMTLPDDIENYIHRIGRCGRADRMGLAISLVATAREKVWYHKCPSKGKECLPSPGNTKLTLPFGPDGKLLPSDEGRWLVDEGGCAVWYDEQLLLERTQTRVGGRIQMMDVEDFSVPNVLESPLPEDQRKKKEPADVDMENAAPSRRALKRKLEVPQAVVYGARKKDASLATATKQAHAIAPVVEQLCELERRAQQVFNRMIWGAWSNDMSATAEVPAATTVTASLVKPSANQEMDVKASANQETLKKPAPSPVASGEKVKKKMRW